MNSAEVKKQIVERIRESLACRECEIGDNGECQMGKDCYCRDDAKRIVDGIEEVIGLDLGEAAVAAHSKP